MEAFTSIHINIWDVMCTFNSCPLFFTVFVMQMKIDELHSLTWLQLCYMYAKSFFFGHLYHAAVLGYSVNLI
jgi:hypothetical protein